MSSECCVWLPLRLLIHNTYMSIHCVGYCRVSTHNQKEEGTIELQHVSLDSYVQKNGFSMRAVFEDNGVSGSLHERDGLNKMFDYLESNVHVKHVVIYKLDRLARDLYLQEHLIKRLESLGVKLLSTQEDNLDSDDPMRKAFRQFSGIVAELEKGFILMRLSGGRNKKASSGKWAGGRIPYGYESQEKDLIMYPERAAVIAAIFVMRRNEHLTLRAIANRLNVYKIPTSSGKKWYASTIRYVLRNPLYRGILKFKEMSNERSDLRLIGQVNPATMYKKEAQFVQQTSH